MREKASFTSHPLFALRPPLYSPLALSLILFLFFFCLFPFDSQPWRAHSRPLPGIQHAGNGLISYFPSLFGLSFSLIFSPLREPALVLLFGPRWRDPTRCFRPFPGFFRSSSRVPGSPSKAGSWFLLSDPLTACPSCPKVMMAL